MSAKTPNKPAKPKAPPALPAAETQNTSAPASPVIPAEELATGAAPAASAASLHEAGQQTEKAAAVPPAGGDPIARELIISAKVDGFRRAGRRWSTSPQTVPIAEFTTEQVDALLKEPNLDVVVVAD